MPTEYLVMVRGFSFIQTVTLYSRKVDQLKKILDVLG